MKRLFFFCVFLLPALTLLAADPVLKFSLDSAGVATITPILPKLTPYDFHPYSAADGSLVLGLTWVNASGRAELAFFSLPLKYEGNPSPIPPGPIPPNPGPVPPTPPPPVPPPVTQRCQFVIIEETADSTQDFANCRVSKAIRDYCKAGGHEVFFLDKDVKDKSGNPPPGYAKWLLMAIGKPLPFIVVANSSGSAVLNGEGEKAPTNEAGMLDYMRRFGGTAGATTCPSGNCPLQGGKP